MKYIRFSKFRSEKSGTEDEAERLRKLKTELARIKKQRIALFIIIAAACTTIILLTHLLTNGTSKTQTQTQTEPRGRNSQVRE